MGRVRSSGSSSPVAEYLRTRDDYFRRYSHRAIDLTDSLSFAIMERLMIDSAFAFDRDFEVRGFVILPGLRP